MKIACLRIVLRHVPVLQLHVHVQAQVMIRLETIFDIVNIGLHFFHKDVRLYAASCSEV